MINKYNFEQTRRRVLSGEGGSVLILTLLILMVLSIMATVAVRSTNTGVSAAGVYNSYQETTYLADGGSNYAYAIIERAIGNGMAIDPKDTANVTSSANLILEINASSKSNIDSADPDSANYAPNASITIAGQNIDLDIDFTRSRKLPGASSEFAARYEGIGAGGAGGVGLLYTIDSNYKRDTKSESTVRLTFQCVEGGGRCL
ncbi:MAG: hypothetical protein ACE5EN_00410 [Nitrospinota bacterium]